LSANLFRASGAGTLRQVMLAEAMRAWCFLQRGDLRRAALAFEPVELAARSDPVLAQVVELNRVSAALAAVKEDWAVAAEADARVLDGLDPANDRPGLRREAALTRVGALAALGRWGAAARMLDVTSASDAVSSLRRAIALRRAGQVGTIPEAVEGN